jgi:hypothetical protein
MHKVISSIEQFEKDFPSLIDEKERKLALGRYFQIHGVVKLVPTEKDKWPKLIYPNIGVLDFKIKESKDKKKIYAGKLNEWKMKHLSASMYHQVNQVKKFAEPVYWQHIAKTMTDADYRKDADSVKLPAHLVADKKWKPMVKMFVNDIEYRKQLSETVTTSMVYKKERKVAKFADDQQNFRMDASDKQIKEIEEKIKELEETELALKELQKWAKE